jgi:hypothetical protein
VTRPVFLTHWGPLGALPFCRRVNRLRDGSLAWSGAPEQELRPLLTGRGPERPDWELTRLEPVAGWGRYTHLAEFVVDGDPLFVLLAATPRPTDPTRKDSTP